MSAARVARTGGMLFDGRSGYVRVDPDPRLYPDDFTIMAWVNIVATGWSFTSVADAGRVYPRNWWMLTGPYSTPRLLFGVQGTGGMREIYFPIVRTGEWHHYAVVKDGAALYLYFNGAFHTGSTMLGDYVKDSSQPITIGCRNDIRVFSNVIVSDFRMFERPLPLSDIMLVYQRGEPIRKGLILWYPFYEGSGDIVRDVSGNNLHGTRIGGAYWMVKPAARTVAPARVLARAR